MIICHRFIAIRMDIDMKINKLFIIPHAGGMVNSYSFLCEYFKDEFQVCLIELAGHGGRYNEKLYSDFKEATNDVYMQIKSKLNDGENYAIMGHSMGAWLTYEVYYLLRQLGDRLPVQLCFSGAKAPTDKEPVLQEKSKHELIQVLHEQGGTPKEILENKDFIDFFLPILKSDYEMIGKYKAEIPSERIIPRITVFCANADDKFTPRDIDSWKTLSNKCSIYYFEGGHFYIYQKGKELAEIIINELKNLSLH